MHTAVAILALLLWITLGSFQATERQLDLRLIDGRRRLKIMDRLRRRGGRLRRRGGPWP
jgi:hypothetical protein